MKILVIGGTGLISTAITNSLINRGDDVTIFNRGRSSLNIQNGYKRILGDRRDYKAFEAQMGKAGTFDCVVDMICFMPEEAESAVRAFGKRVGQFIFCSTVDTYTKPARRYPITEDGERDPSPVFPYAFNKGKCEKIFIDAHERGDFPLTIIRPAYTYGEGRGILHTFGGGEYYLNRIRKGKPIIVHGDGTSFWSSCHRDDVGKAFVGAVGNPKTYGKSYHVTGEEWLTWDQYHQKVAEAMGASVPKLVHIPTDVLAKFAPGQSEWCVINFSFNNIFDNTAAKIDLGFKYSVSWKQGVKRVVEWLDKHNRIENSIEEPFYEKILENWMKVIEGITQV